MSRCGQPPGGGAWALSYPVPVLRGPSLTLPPPPNGYRRLRGSGPGAVEPVCSRVVVGGPGGNNPVTSLQTHRFPWGGLQLKVFQAARLSSSGRPLQRFPAPFGVVPVRSPSGWGGGRVRWGRGSLVPFGKQVKRGGVKVQRVGNISSPQMHHCKRYRSPEQESYLGHRWKRKRSRSRDYEGRLRYPPRRDLARRSRSRR